MYAKVSKVTQGVQGNLGVSPLTDTSHSVVERKHHANYYFYCKRFKQLMGVIMFMLSVYYHDILRYTIIANFDKVQELRNQGYYVQFKLVAAQG
jgi:hypothetical protein